MGTPPLHGITVVSLEQAVAAPFATRQLADLGARVIKVERPGAGDFARGYDRTVLGQASYFVWLNRGKESIELDIKNSADRTVLDNMIAGADVLVQNLIPGAMARIGLDAATVRAKHPDLIHVSISGYGDHGPYRDKKAYDALIQAETGLIAATGSPEAPAKVGASVADIATGMYAYSGILTALYRRERTGSGSSLDIAMIDAVGEWMMQPAYYSSYGGKPWQRTGTRHGTLAPYGPYRCGDGEQVFLAVQSDREWEVLCREVIGDPSMVGDARFIHNPERVEHNRLITESIERAFAGKTVTEVVDLLEKTGIANARLHQPADLFDHPQLRARDRWRTVDAPGGRVRALLPPVSLHGTEALMLPVPSLGEHNEPLRQEFGA
ncbi:CaiB/BaiF CoA transferase family protein [Amycolatopsis acididurans]|uniref:CaiB/BaiF CoA transferase family protein n=1 Tax=Amycolatopsis acididurans TaxID=2724524 RepID=UPI0028A824E2|nr:CaiB/BaiF CoA-transferase family protein [Amycolatopsis acididurans]